MRNVLKISSIAALVTVFGFFSCSNDDDSSSTENTEAIENYADLVYESYKDSYDTAVTMQTAINTLVDTPSAVNLEAAQDAWLAAREIYGQTEAYRECNGPVDTEGQTWSLGSEGQMNAWPIDESYIDYVSLSNPDTSGYANSYTGIVSGTSTISEAALAELNEAEDDKSISTGWHAVEFLLWGQDNTSPADDLPGQRAYTDYSTADNYVRRGEYLQAATDLLVSDLKDLVDTWASNGEYRTVFNALDEATALKQLINGAFFIAGDELSSERMIAPVDSTDGINNSGQEDEHSCFADNTHIDVWANAQGVYNVVFGKYGTVSGKSFYDLVNDVDADQATSLKEAADLAIEKVNAIKNNAEPFDYLITQEISSDAEFGPVMQAVEALKDWADIISESSSTIGIDLE